MGKKKKKKRTPEQLLKIQQRQMEKYNKNQEKKNLILKNRKTLMDNPYDQNEEYFYHITTPKKLEKILKSKGLVSSNIKKTHKSISLDGWIYCLDTDDKNIWNGVSSFCWDTPYREWDDVYYREGKEYVVIGIKKSSVEGREMEKDNDCGEIISDDFRRINISLIDHKDLCYVGKYITEHKKYEEWKENVFLPNKLKKNGINPRDIKIKRTKTKRPNGLLELGWDWECDDKTYLLVRSILG
jgi:hypothetical protein